MMIKKKSNPWARLKYLYVLPLATVAVAAFARPEVSNQLDEISSVKVNDLTSIVKAEEVKSMENSSDEKFTLNGQVMEYSSKKPVPGASVIVRGTTHGTLADAEGKFQLQVKKGDVIIVSYVGLQTQQLPVQSGANLVVWMREEVQSMEEIMVVGMNTPSEEADKKVKYTEVKVEETEASQKEEVIFQVVEQMPEFPGGMGEAMKFLAKNIKYPASAQQAKIEGRVIVQFVVDKDGSISDVKIARGVSPDLDAEAMRVVSLMPKWNPGKQRGKAVSVKYTMPIMFRLQTPQPEKKEEEKPAYLQLNMKVDKDVSSEDVAMVKDVLREGYREMTMEFPQGVNKSVEQLPSGGVGYYSEHSRTIRVENGKSPLIIVDGEVKGNGMDILKSVPVNQIQTISVMKDKDSIAKYGDKANDGVIEIVTKKNK